jgi:hypothetical protein
MHHTLKPRCKVYSATDCTVRVYQAEFSGRSDFVVVRDVGVVVEVCGELGGCVGDVEGHFFVVVDGPVCGAGCSIIALLEESWPVR